MKWRHPINDDDDELSLLDAGVSLAEIRRQSWAVYAGAHRLLSVREETNILPQATPFTRVLLVGEDNPQSDDPVNALWPAPAGCAGHRLMGILGLGAEDYLSIWRINLCADGRGWRQTMAQHTAGRLTRLVDAPWCVVVLLGRRVAGAFSWVLDEDLPPWSSTPRWVKSQYDEKEVRLNALVSLPHPSGRSREWNAPGAAERARAILAEVAPDVPWGRSARAAREGGRRG